MTEKCNGKEKKKKEDKNKEKISGEGRSVWRKKKKLYHRRAEYGKC